MKVLKTYPFSEIEKAHAAISPYIHRTSILRSSALDSLVGAKMFFKCENFQKIGAFKMRGAAHAIHQLKMSGYRGPVVTHSSGNHAQALAKAAKEQGLQAYLVMPETAPKVKVNAVRFYGGEITFCAPNLAARESEMKKIQSKNGAHFIPPYDEKAIILGQATAAKEMLEELPDLDSIICPVGGGGLLAGTALATKHINQEIEVFGSEPKGADDAYQSFKAGKLIPQTNPQTIADGLLTSLGTLNFEIIHQLVDDIFCVSDEEITSSMRLIWERLKIIVEPSSATVLAALLKNAKLFHNKKVGLILSGGNVDLDNYFTSINNQKQ